MPNRSIGIIGVGRMGYGIASNIVQRSNRIVYVYDKNSSKVICLNQEVGKRCKICSSLKDIAQRSSILFLCLPLPKISEEVIFKKNGILKWLKKGSIIIELSTLPPKISLTISHKCKIGGIKYLESPIKGRKSEAKLGILHLEIGGNIKVYKRIKPILKLFAKKTTYTGQVGSASTLKLLRNIPRYTNLILSFEMLRIINLLKLSQHHQKLLLQGIIDNVNWVWGKNLDNIIENKILPSDCIDIRVKDTLMINDFLKAYGRFPMMELARQAFSGYKSSKQNNIIKLIEKKSNNDKKKIQ